MSGFDLKQDYHSSANREQPFNVLNQSGPNVSDTITMAGAGPALPPDWAWICCDQDHGSSSRVTVHDASTTPIISAASSPTMNASHQPQPPQDHMMNYRHARSDSGSSFPGTTPFNFSQGETRLSSHSHMHAHAKHHPGRPKNQSHRSFDFSAPNSTIARTGSTGGAGIEYQGGSTNRNNRGRRSGLAKSLSIAVPGSTRPYGGGSTTASPVLQGLSSKPGSRPSTPGGFDVSSQSDRMQAARSANTDKSYASARIPGQASSSSDPIIVGIPGVGSMNSGPTEAQLAQWMTYCCDKDDCQDPFPPPQSTGPTTPANSFAAFNGNLGDTQQIATGMFSQWFSGTNSMAIDLPQGQPTLEPYCCGGGPDCHEPIIDSIGCEGHPQSCGLPECCPPQSKSMGMQGNDMNKDSLDLFMKGVDWECLDADCIGLHSLLPNDPSLTSGSRTPMTLTSGTQATNTPQGAFSTQPSPYIGGGTEGSQLQQQEFDLGPSARSSDQQLEAFLAAVAKGDLFAGESGMTSTNLDAVMSHDASGLPIAAMVPNPHVCHWQNCHSDFATVQELLAHVSSEHLKIKPSRNQPDVASAYQFGMTTSSTGDQTGSRPGSSSDGIAKSHPSLMPSTVTPPFSVLAEQFAGGAFVDSHNASNGYVEAGAISAMKKDGLMACLWDDCIPGPSLGSLARPFTGAFAHSASAPQVGPGHQSNDFAKELESLRLLSQTTSSLRDSTDDTVPSTTPATHVHKACHVPVAVTNDNPLDSASAVLKHLLEQHLGTDATNSLLDIAQNHYTSISASQLGKARGPVDSASSGFASPTLVPPPRDLKQAGSRRESALEMPSSRTSDVKDEQVVFRCRWHGCDKTFEDNTSLTDHISNIHVGRGKSKYECLWDGCVRCDTECDSCDEGDRMDVEGGEKRGRKFATRQKVLRHIQSHTGYRPFVCHLCGQSVSEQATLNAHLRRHAEEKPFKCDEEDCDKAFASAASLAVHKRAHTGTKHHVCPHCGRGFIELSNLTKHIRTHTGDKPFSCSRSGCGRAFCRSDQLKRHMATCRYRRSSDDGQFSTTPSE